MVFVCDRTYLVRYYVDRLKFFKTGFLLIFMLNMTFFKVLIFFSRQNRMGDVRRTGNLISIYLDIK